MTQEPTPAQKPEPKEAVASTQETNQPEANLAKELPNLAQRLVEEVVEEVIEEEQVDGEKRRHKGIYLLPSLFTTGALFSGFYAIIAGMNQDFTLAAIAIFAAMVFDGLDGRVARLTGTESAFGAEYDSLSDMVSFGVAPALVAFSWMLKDLGKIGWVAAFVFVAGAALRLARFNVQIGSTDKKWFTGLPSPAAAATVAGLVWVLHETNFASLWPEVLVAVVIAFTGLLMVSNVKYYSFKDIDLKNRVPFMVLIGLVLLLAVIALQPATMLLSLCIIYAFSGPLVQVLSRIKK